MDGAGDRIEADRGGRPPRAGGAPREELLDVAVIGAGLSGICAAAHLAAERPQDKVLVLEARGAIGGTWDQFRYPGVRSDSDMFTLGYRFRPWTGASTLADGESILSYIREAAQSAGLQDRIALRHKLTSADWCARSGRWRLKVETPEGQRRFAARFVFFCTGYYDFETPHAPRLPGADQFSGVVVHPQFWPQDLQLRGKRVALIGSGATAVTLLPALVEQGATVTQVQRTPSYVMSLPNRDPAAEWMRRRLPMRLAHGLTRWKNILQGMLFYQYSKLRPNAVRRLVRTAAVKDLGGDAAQARHFDPPYDPWDQRFCIAPDGDYFAAIRSGAGRIVTGEIESLTPGGLRMADGEAIDADIVITATGLRLKMAGGAALCIDGRPFDVAQSTVYRGAMFSGAPNLFFTFGYVNASWTLKSERIVEWALGVMEKMDRLGATVATPAPPSETERSPLVGLSSSYIRRGAHLLPRQGQRAPWRAHQNVLRDLFTLRRGRFGGELALSAPAKDESAEAAERATTGAAEVR